MNPMHSVPKPRRTWMRTLAAAVPLALALAGLSACDRLTSSRSFKAVDITGADYARRLDLPDLDGKLRTLSDFRGKLVVVFFGFTQCPDVCPTTLAKMSEVMKLLGESARKVQVVFVTVDPERDTAQVLREYVAVFDPGFIALRGDAEQLTAVRKEFRLIVQKNAGATPTSYTIDHTAASYVFDTEGRPRLYVRHEATAADIAADLRQLLQ
jgi:protein SCO1/2